MLDNINEVILVNMTLIFQLVGLLIALLFDTYMNKRQKKLMLIQQKISKEINEKYIGKTIQCVVEGYTDDGLIILRSQHDAPEIDGVVYAKSDRQVVPCEFEKVLIKKADEYDLYGVVQ